MRIGEPTFQEPSSSASIQRANDVERAVLECEVGQWLPVDFDKSLHAAQTVALLKKRGYEARRQKLRVWVRAPESARPHVHRWIIPPGVMDATSVDQHCACGEVKRAVNVAANGAVEVGS